MNIGEEGEANVICTMLRYFWSSGSRDFKLENEELSENRTQIVNLCSAWLLDRNGLLHIRGRGIGNASSRQEEQWHKCTFPNLRKMMSARARRCPTLTLLS